MHERFEKHWGDAHITQTTPVSLEMTKL